MVGIIQIVYWYAIQISSILIHGEKFIHFPLSESESELQLHVFFQHYMKIYCEQCVYKIIGGY